MPDSEEPHTSGWSFLKVIGVIVGLVGMVGFGVCTLCGMFFIGGDGVMLLLVVAGALMTALCIWMVVAIVRKAREEREVRNRQDP